MSVYDIILRRRSIRRFRQKKIPFAILKKIVNASRFAPSGANVQPCEFIVVEKKELVYNIFSALRWAGYIRPQGDPPPGKQPTAYIIILINKRKKPLCPESDAAACVQNMLLVAEEENVGSCWLGAIDRDKIRRLLGVPRYCEIKYVVALGYADERPKIEPIRNSIKYWKDSKGTLHVPKRRLQELLHRNRY